MCARRLLGARVFCACNWHCCIFFLEDVEECWAAQCSANLLAAFWSALTFAMSSVDSSGTTFSCRLLPLSVLRILALIPLGSSRNFCRVCVSSCSLPCCFCFSQLCFPQPFSALHEIFHFWLDRIFALLDDLFLVQDFVIDTVEFRIELLVLVLLGL